MRQIALILQRWVVFLGKTRSRPEFKVRDCTRAWGKVIETERQEYGKDHLYMQSALLIHGFYSAFVDSTQCVSKMFGKKLFLY